MDFYSASDASASASASRSSQWLFLERFGIDSPESGVEFRRFRSLEEEEEEEGNGGGDEEAQ